MLPVVSPRSQRKEPRVQVMTPKESSADKRHYILIVVPGHRSFIKNMTIGAHCRETQLATWFQQTASSLWTLPERTTRQAKSKNRDWSTFPG